MQGRGEVDDVVMSHLLLIVIALVAAVNLRLIAHCVLADLGLSAPPLYRA